MVAAGTSILKLLDEESFGPFASPTYQTLFICHASYEARAYKVTELSISSLNIVEAVVIGSTETFQDDPKYRACYEELTRRLERNGARSPGRLLCMRSNLMDFMSKIHQFIGSIAQTAVGRVVVDISVFPKDRLWVLLDYLKRWQKTATEINLIYVEPKQYNTDSKVDGWLSKGVRRISYIPGFNGHQTPKKRVLLALVLGHEEERIQITVRNMEPATLVLIGQGSIQYRDDAQRLADDVERHIGADHAHIVSRDEYYVADSRDYVAVRNAIRCIFARNSPSYNIIVGANGTKIQSLGAMLACMENRRIAAVYAAPQLYNREAYSTGVGRVWHLSPW